ncbi:MAG TPA: hypothetical protein PK735_02955 [Flavobacteriales bacterium]|nr:hypothetical protein [Flavobacteriales bacterium]HQX38850.1 hypothetical protein [Flavobacteriales bacterium]HQZ41824.1 hypothetical protein [Flavobacteriales bacterium]HQZ93037.1 hypothetical protein [Flavobacteriales bacterium]
MFTLLHIVTSVFGRFDRWFSARFGWFFTNGMKAHRQRPTRVEHA